jgi:hypothetical protein
VSRDLWIDTHERIYKYIRERNALKILLIESDDLNAQPGYFSFTADDQLADSLFNVELTLKISLPPGWMEESVTVGPGDEFSYMAVEEDETGRFILYDWLPVSGVTIAVYDGKYTGTGLGDRNPAPSGVTLSAAPNPFLYETLVKVTGQNSINSYLIVTDIHGRMVREIREPEGSSFHLARENLPPGIYIIQLIDSGIQVASYKLVAQ